jgi:hypothetical protein
MGEEEKWRKKECRRTNRKDLMIKTKISWYAPHEINYLILCNAIL